MNCEMATKALSLLLYGELSFEEEELLQQHLDGCAGCREALERERRLHSLAGQFEIEPPSALLAECRQALAGRLGELRPAGNSRRGFEFMGRLREWLSRLRPAGMLWKPAAALGLVALGFFGARLGGVSEPVASRVRYVEPAPTGEVRIVLEETRQRVLSGRPDDSRIRELLLAAAADAEDPGLRAASLEILRRQPGSDEVRTALIHALRRDPNPGVRLKALEGLKSFAGEPRTRRALAEALLEDDNPGVRTQAVDLLVEQKEREMVGVLQQLLLTEDNSYIRQRSQRALREMNASVETF